MSADALIAKLDKARSTGRGSWKACCPAHEDRNPSMTIRELDDGRVLLHCFSGCSVEDILGALGLEFDALFPPKPIDHAKPERRPFNPHDVIAALEIEIGVVYLVAADMRKGKRPTADDMQRLGTAVDRINGARRMINGSR